MLMDSDKCVPSEHKVRTLINVTVTTDTIDQQSNLPPRSNISSLGCYNFLTSVPLSILLSLSPPVESPFLYLSFPSELSDTHAFLLLLAQPCALLLFNKHSLKAMHFFTIKHFQVGYLFPSLDLNIL